MEPDRTMTSLKEKTKVLRRGNQKSIHWEPNLNITVGFDLV